MKKQSHSPLANGLDKVRNEMRNGHRGIMYQLDKEVYSLEYKKAINAVMVKKDIISGQQYFTCK